VGERSDEPFGAGQAARPEYIEQLHIVLRSSPEFDGEPDEVISATIDVGGVLPLPNIVPDVERWLADRGQQTLEIETRVHHVHVGAAGVGAELVVALFGASSTVALQELWRFVRDRLQRDDRVRRPADWYRKIGPDEAVDPLAYELAHALDMRRVELELVELQETPEALTAVYEVAGSGSRYRNTVQSDAHSIVRLDD